MSFLFAAMLWIVPLQAQELGSLVGSEWGGGGKAFVQFKADGKVSGHGGCNRFFGRFSQNGAKLRIGPLASTRMACPPKIMAAEGVFLKTLEQARGFKGSHLRLSLFDKGGKKILKLLRRDAD